jgi:cholesterol oxidase
MLSVWPLSNAAAKPKPKPDYEAIIVGSGFGGSIAAYNLARAGAPALLLERGHDWHVNDSKTDSRTANRTRC